MSSLNGLGMIKPNRIANIELDIDAEIILRVMILFPSNCITELCNLLCRYTS